MTLKYINRIDLQLSNTIRDHGYIGRKGHGITDPECFDIEYAYDTAKGAKAHGSRFARWLKEQTLSVFPAKPIECTCNVMSVMFFDPGEVDQLAEHESEFDFICCM